MGRKKVEDQYNKLITHWDPGSSIAEMYRIIETNIDFSKMKYEIKTILVTSTEFKEGKSVTSGNLAIAMAQRGKKVVYVDTDVRNANGHDMFDVVNDIGVTSYLSGDSTLENIIKKTEIPNLSVITAGPNPLNLTKLFSTSAMNDLVEGLKNRFDNVIFDSGPMLATAESIILASLVDGCILVVDEKKTDRERALKVKHLLDNTKANWIGVVINNKK